MKTEIQKRDYLWALRDFNIERGQTNRNNQTVGKCSPHDVFGIKLHQMNVNRDIINTHRG